MNRTLIAAAAVTALLGVGSHLQFLSHRLDQLEREPRHDPARISGLKGEVESVRASLQEAADMRRASEAELSRGLAALAQRADAVTAAAEEANAQLSVLDARLSAHSPEALAQELEVEIAKLRAELLARTTELDELAGEAARLAREEGTRLSELRARVEPLTRDRDANDMWNDLVGPVVQLAGDATVGSGVLLESRAVEDGRYLTYLLTSWHVVRDIYGSLDRIESPVSVKLYMREGGTRIELAHMVEYDIELDIALLTLDTSDRLPCGARLASRERVEAVRVFDSIYAVGCPLGNDPIPTPGEVAASHHDVEGGHYWMISAPTYIGNSGGGIFDAQTHELLGIFSKIYTHGTNRSTIVPHMGLATPLSVVYSWLDRVGQSRVVDSQDPRELDASVQTASATRE
jgi:hypothetical protein